MAVSKHRFDRSSLRSTARAWEQVESLAARVCRQTLGSPPPTAHNSVPQGRLSLPSLKMPPRGNEGLDFTPILTHYLFLFTSILSVVCSILLSRVSEYSCSPDRLVYCLHRSGICDS